MRKGVTVGVAWDAVAGALLVAVNGAALAPVFSEGLNPGPAVGAGLFPALSGKGCSVKYNLGKRPFQHTPPSGLHPCAAAAHWQVAWRHASAACERGAAHVTALYCVSLQALAC
jgi:hypothetical protein